MDGITIDDQFPLKGNKSWQVAGDGRYCHDDMVDMNEMFQWHLSTKAVDVLFVSWW